MLGIEKEGLIKVDDSHTPVNYIVMPLCRKGLSVSSKRAYLFGKKGRRFFDNR